MLNKKKKKRAFQVYVHLEDGQYCAENETPMATPVAAHSKIEFFREVIVECCRYLVALS